METFLTIKKLIEAVVNIPLRMRIECVHPRTVLMISPQYLNYGDHLIAQSELDFFKKNLNSLPLDVNYTFFDLWDKKVCRSLKKDDILWVTGGGYIGDLWPESHNIVEKIIDKFPDNMIVFAPQTAYFKNIESKEALAFKNKVQTHGKCIFFSRDTRTMETLNTLGINSRLAPDFGLLYRTDYRNWPIINKYSALCLRDDEERIINDSDRKQIEKALKTVDLPLHNIFMAKKHCEIPTWSRKYFLRKKFREYCFASVVITDRLHGMVFSAISGVPCVVFDNKSRKVSGVWQEWLSKLNYIKVIDSSDQIESALQEVLAFSDKKSNRDKYKILSNGLLSKYERIFCEYIK